MGQFCNWLAVLTVAWCLSGCRSDPTQRSAEERPEENTVLAQLAGKLQAKLPTGWHVSTNMFLCDDEVKVVGEVNLELYRQEQVCFSERLRPNSPVPDEVEQGPEPYTFYMNLNKTKYLTPAEHKAIRDRNAEIDGKCREFTKSLMDVPRHGKARAFDDLGPSMYHPLNESQSNRVAAFRTFCEAHKKTFLPADVYYHGLAFILYDPRDGLEIDDASFDAECNAVIKAIKTVMKEY